MPGEQRREERVMQVIVVRSPKCLAGLLRVLFKMKKEADELEKKACEKESELLKEINQKL